MRRAILLISLLGTTAGCAFRGDVQRMGVDFNATVAGTANELTLLNVLRAKEYQPLHFTSYSAVHGNIEFTGGATLGGTVNEDASTRGFDGAGALVSHSVAEGVAPITPGVSGQIVTGPSFDVTIHDEQEFYQGIMTSVPSTTISHLLYQGWSSDLISYLLVQRVTFRLSENLDQAGNVIGKNDRATPVAFEKGTVVYSIETGPHGIQASSPADVGGATEFERFVGCFELSPEVEAGKPFDLAPANRLKEITVEELGLLDGEKLDLSGGLTAQAGDDSTRMVQRVGKDREKLKLFMSQKGDCVLSAASQNAPDAVLFTQDLRAAVTQQKVHLGERGGEDVAALAGGKLRPPAGTELGNLGKPVPVQVDYVFRSVLGVFEFLGDYLRTEGDDLKTLPHAAVYKSGGMPLFKVQRYSSGAKPIVSATLNGVRYSVVEQADESHKLTLQIVGLLQQLVNLQKKATEKPSTQTVRVVG